MVFCIMGYDVSINQPWPTEKKPDGGDYKKRENIRVLRKKMHEGLRLLNISSFKNRKSKSSPVKICSFD